MARILLAWELGGNNGHAVRLARLASELTRAGHATSLAVQRPEAFRRWRDAPGCAEIRQAPVWPGLLRHAETPALRGEAAWGDLLAGVGMTDSGSLEYLLRCWDRLIADARADLVIADFAPAVMLAARGRIPVVAVGTGFTVPPADGVAFPLLRTKAQRPLIDEAALLQVVNRALWRLDRPALDRLTQIARADMACPATFTELDPYRRDRADPPLPPFLSGPPGTTGTGQAVFAYAAVTGPQGRQLLQALRLVAVAGLAVTAFLPGCDGADADDLTGAGVDLLRTPMAPSLIAARSRLLVGTGGLGTVSSALAAGLPMVLLPVDLEKRLTAQAVADMGAGQVLQAGPDGSAQVLADAIITAARDPDALPRAQARAAGFRDRLDDPAVMISARIAALF